MAKSVPVVAKSFTSLLDAPNLKILAGGIYFAYRDFGNRDSSPVVMLNHWGANLDNLDPYIADGLGRSFRVIAIDYRGIGGSGGQPLTNIDGMSDDMISVMNALGLRKVFLLGFSLGGFVAQNVALKAPELIAKMIVAGSGPAGGEGVGRWGSMPWYFLKSFFTFRDPKFYLFFPGSEEGQVAAIDFLKRIQQRTKDRDVAPSLRAFYNQTLAAKEWGNRDSQNLSEIDFPVLVVNGDTDIMLPTQGSRDIAGRIRESSLIIYKGAGHGAIFQNHRDFTERAANFFAQIS